MVDLETLSFEEGKFVFHCFLSIKLAGALILCQFIENPGYQNSDVEPQYHHTLFESIFQLNIGEDQETLRN
jgi:hypothetical protein